LISFKAFSSQDNEAIFLEWQTASEVNSDYFIVEKSYDGITFFPIDRVRSAQNSTTIQHYTSVDNDPRKGDNYFRIQEVDQEQFMSFSNLINVFINDRGEVPAIYPNPIEDLVKVYSKDLKNKELQIKILDINGQCIYTGKHTAQGGQLFISAASLNIKKQGMYFLNYEDGGEMISLKFLSL